MNYCHWFLILNLFFSLSCKTTTEEEPTVSRSPSKSLEEPEEAVEERKPQTIIVPTGSLGEISEVRKKILEKSLESQLDDHFDIVPKELFEEAQEKAWDLKLTSFHVNRRSNFKKSEYNAMLNNCYDYVTEFLNFVGWNNDSKHTKEEIIEIWLEPSILHVENYLQM